MPGRRFDHLRHRDPDEWASGDEAMTPQQERYLEVLCRQTGYEMDHDLTKAEASRLIEELEELCDSPRRSLEHSLERSPRSPRTPLGPR